MVMLLTVVIDLILERQCRQVNGDPAPKNNCQSAKINKHFKSVYTQESAHNPGYILWNATFYFYVRFCKIFAQKYQEN